MFDLLLDVMDRFLNLRDTNAECASQRRSRISGFSTKTRSFVLKTQRIFRHEKVFAMGENWIAVQKYYNLNVFSF